MSIWTYAELGRRLNEQPDRNDGIVLKKTCAYCSSPMVTLAGDDLPESAFKGMNATEGALLGCPACGWWTVLSLRGAAPFQTHDGGFAELRQVSGVLKNLDLNDLTLPLQEVRAYLIARYADRFRIHPRKYEEIVGGVFSDFGFRVRVTSYSGDEGIDVFVLDGQDNATVGVQVKRYRSKISAEQIRSFVGALALQGLTTGIYITTGEYEKGAQRTAASAQPRVGIGITLLDAKRFYEALRVSTRATLWNAEDDTAPYHELWQGVKEYMNDSPLPTGQRAKSWLEMAEYVWGSSW